MKYIIFLTFFLSVYSLSAQKQTLISDSIFVFSYEKEGKLLSDTIKVYDWNKKVVNDFEKLLKDPNYHIGYRNDTIKNAKGQPIIVVLGDDFFGAQIARFEYNTKHQLVSVTGYSRKGQVRPFDKDIAIMAYKYDEKGNIIEIRSSGDDGKLISSEFEDTPIVKRVYNAQNQQTEEWYLNEKGKLRAPYAIAKFEYSKSGEQIFIGWFNEKGEKGEFGK